MDFIEFKKVMGYEHTMSISKVAKLVGVSQQIMLYHVNKKKIPLKYIQMGGKKITSDGIRTEQEIRLFEMYKAYLSELIKPIKHGCQALGISTSEQIAEITGLSDDKIVAVMEGKETDFSIVIAVLVACGVNYHLTFKGGGDYQATKWGEKEFGKPILNTTFKITKTEHNPNFVEKINPQHINYK